MKAHERIFPGLVGGQHRDARSSAVGLDGILIQSSVSMQPTDTARTLPALVACDGYRLGQLRCQLDRW
jgi:hypothetical protein